MLDVQITAGVHTGEIERRDRDISGLAVHLASRVADRSAPDEFVVTRTVTGLVAGSGQAFESLGDFELEGLAGEWRLFRLRLDR